MKLSVFIDELKAIAEIAKGDPEVTLSQSFSYGTALAVAYRSDTGEEVSVRFSPAKGEFTRITTSILEKKGV